MNQVILVLDIFVFIKNNQTDFGGEISFGGKLSLNLIFVQNHFAEIFDFIRFILLIHFAETFIFIRMLEISSCSVNRLKSVCS